jgi:S-adenosylmethionine hydrolase
MAGYEWITFTSDYGLEDHFVGVCHGVMARVAPGVRVIDVTHAVAAQDVRHGALVLAQAVPYLPRAVHLAVVDPGVGTGRSVVAVDHFGNLALDLRRQDLERVGVAAGDPVEVRVGGQAHRLVFGETFASVPAGDLVLHEDSFGSLAVAVNRGRAAERLGARPGHPVEVARPEGSGASLRGSPADRAGET